LELSARTAGHAVELLPPGADKNNQSKWLDVRRKGVTASEIASIMGLSDKPSKFTLWWQKQGFLESESNTRMAFGHFCEPFICQQFAETHPEYLVLQVGLAAHSERLWQMATCDRIAVSPDAALNHVLTNPVPVEAKTSATFQDWGPEGTDIIPVNYRCQLMWQMDVLGASYGYLSCLFLMTQEIRTYVVPYDSEDAVVMRAAAAVFRQSLDQGDEPPIDGSDSTTWALKSVYGDLEDVEQPLPRSLVNRYRSAVRRYDEADKRKKLVSNQIRAALGNARRGVDIRTGERIVSRTRYARKAYTVKETTIDQLTPVRAKSATAAIDVTGSEDDG